MKNTMLVRVFALALGAAIALVWAGSATSVARAGTPATGTQLRYTAGIVVGQVTNPGAVRARDALLEYIRAERANDPDNPELVPPVDAEWKEEDITEPGRVGATTFRYTSGAWMVTVSYPVVPEPIYDVNVETSFQRGNDVQYFTWSSQVDNNGRIVGDVVAIGALQSIEAERGMPRTGDASGTDLPVALLVASLLSILGAGAMLRWRSRVRAAEETYILR